VTEISESAPQTRAQVSDVLIVDDDPPIRHLLRQVFKRIGLEAREARDGVEAISYVEESVPRLIMLDLMMPRMNGWEVLETLQKRGLLERIPVVVLTALGSQRTEGLKAYGVRAVLSKPFEIRDLIATVKSILEPAC
jgi:CheY-like chemotaxis protein